VRRKVKKCEATQFEGDTHNGVGGLHEECILINRILEFRSSDNLEELADHGLGVFGERTGKNGDHIEKD
jgi:hypothetical protein